jgi:uncharacterized protein YlxW (UPF0749 family)
MDEDIIGIIAGFLIVFVPVVGITARIALKPVVEAIAKLMAARQGTEAMQLLERRVALLEQELQHTRADMQQLSEERDFYRKLSDQPEAPRLGA